MTAGYDRARLEAELIRDEGERLRVYLCPAGHRTIGVGRNLDATGIRADERRDLGLSVARCCAYGITRAQSRALLANDIAAAEHALDARLPWWRGLAPVRQRVLLEMAFNLGAAKLAAFHATLAHAEHGAFEAAADDMLASLWAHQVGARAERLAAMMRTGKEPS